LENLTKVIHNCCKNTTIFWVDKHLQNGYTICIMKTKELENAMSKSVPCRRDYWKNLYFPSQHKITRTYNVLNEVLFNNKLKPCKIITKTTFKAWAYAYQEPGFRTEIHLNGRFPCEQFFIAVLGHEMVHQWQWDIEAPIRRKQGKKERTGHGVNFYEWKDIFEHHGIHFGINIPHYYK